MSEIVIASLAKSPKNTKCPLLAMSQRWDYQSAKIKHIKVCVQNILRMLECKLDDVNASDCLLMIIWLKCCHSSIKCDFSWATTSWIRLRYTRSCSFHRSSSLPGWCQHCWLARDWSDEVWYFTGWSDRLRRISFLRFTFITSANVTPGPVIKLTKVVLETEIFRHRYL